MFDDDDQDISVIVIIFLGIASVVAIFTVILTMAGPIPAMLFQPPSAQRVAAGPNLGLSLAEGKITLTGTVPDEAARQSLLLQAQVVYGIGNVVDQLKIESGAAMPKWKGRLLDLFARLRGLGDFKFNLAGNRLSLEGLVGTDGLKADFEKWISGFFDGASLQSAIKVAAAGASGRAFDPAVLLNLTIEFATGSAEIPNEYRPRLDLVAAVLKDDGRKLTIAGHTDNVGDPASNKTLSLARAESVKKYLADKGVAADSLATNGFGEERPIADNGTPEGRQHNRRIELLQ